MEGIVNFHHDLFFFLTAICAFVFYMIARSMVLYNSETLKKPLIVNKGSINSSIEYNKENEGIATKIKIIAGINVQTISKRGA